MKVVVTGANGMLGSALCPALKRKGYKVYATDINNIGNDIDLLDVQDIDQINSFVKNVHPDLIIHLAAETDVDKCETQIDHAYMVNAIGTENIALISQKVSVPLIYISTAGVFDGEKQEPYTEFDLPNPVNIYAKTKLEGERIVEKLLSRYFIVRAGWMMGGTGKDKKFVAKIVELLKTKKELSVVTDKLGSPTYTKDLSNNLIQLIRSGRYGLYHIANKGGCSRYDIAKKITEYLKKTDIVIKPITSDKFPLPAPRGRSEQIDNYKLNLLSMNNMPPWQDALKEYLGEINRL